MNTRDRILEAADELFYRDGIRSVSVNTIAEKAGVTKRTLYYHFRSKDDLIAAYLEARNEPTLSRYRRWFDEFDGTVAERIAVVRYAFIVRDLHTLLLAGLPAHTRMTRQRHRPRCYDALHFDFKLIV
jgi:AcrR family transcriptional regulator